MSDQPSGGPPAYRFTVQDRVLLHLAKFEPIQATAQVSVYPEGQTFDGICVALGISPGHASNASNLLAEAGMVVQHLAHVIGPSKSTRRKKVNCLTTAGQVRAKELRRFIEDSKLVAKEIVAGGPVKESNLDIQRMLREVEKEIHASRQTLKDLENRVALIRSLMIGA